MIKNNLPVILLKNLVLLPYQEIRIELKSDISKKITQVSKLYHNSEVLIVCPFDSLEEIVDPSDLPKIGVVGKIRSNIDLPNGNQRLIIEGLHRVEVVSYVNYSSSLEVLDSIVTSINIDNLSELESTAYFRKLMSELENYIEKNSFVSNSIMAEIKSTTSLDKLTDIIGDFLPLPFDKKLSLMLDISPISRAKMLIKEIAIENAVNELESKIETKIKTNLDNEQKEYMLKEKLKVIKNELGETNSKDDDINELKSRIKSLSLPEQVYNKVNKELNRYIATSEVSPDAGIIRNYIEYLISVPWNVETSYEKDLNKIEAKLNSSHYGFEEAKSRIIEYIAVKNMTEDVASPIICLVGPPGVGKTTFAQSISTSLNREFVKISLGGMSDSSELNGHRRAYIGSTPGKIASSLIKCGSINPVFLLDEVDKIKRDYKSDPSSTLLDILDQTQNKKFVDNYLDEEIDLSKVLFILTANDINSIPAVLLDRLEIIELSGYSDNEKLLIAENYLIPTLIKRHGLKTNVIKFSKEAILNIVQHYTNESGVRDLERCISKIIRKIITEHVKKSRKVVSVRVNNYDLENLLDKKEKRLEDIRQIIYPGVLHAVARTSKGGILLDIECSSYKGSGKNTCTGSLGSVTKESIDVAINYIKSDSSIFDIDEEYFDTHDIHVHFTEAGIKKDGPSAGTSIITVILSFLKNVVLPSNVTMTGEVTLKGEILKVGGLKEKIMACVRNNIDTIYIPHANIHDIESLDKVLLQSIKYIPVKNYSEIYSDIFK